MDIKNIISKLIYKYKNGPKISIYTLITPKTKELCTEQLFRKMALKLQYCESAVAICV